MAIEVSAKVVPGGYKLIDAAGEELHGEYPPGLIVSLNVKRPVNPKFRRKWFALLQLVFPHQDSWPTFILFRKAVQRACGFCEIVNGQIFDTSIAFHKMDDDDFAILFEKTLCLIETKIIPNVDRKDIIEQYQSILAGYDDEPIYYYHHPESNTVFTDTKPLEEICTDGLVETITKTQFKELRKKYGEN